MKNIQIIIIGIVATVLFWLLDTVLHYTVFQADSGFLVALLPTDPNELWMRSLVVFMFIGFGFYVRNAMQKQRESINEAIDILESTTDAYLAIDKELKITYINKQAEQLLQVNREAVLGQNMWDVFPDAVNTFYHQFSDSINNRKSLIFTGFYSTIGKWIEIHTHPSQNGLAFYFRDITEKKLLIESNKKLKNVIGHASDGIITINDDGIIETVNDAAELVFGYSRAEMLGKNVTLLMNEQDASKHDEYIRNYLRTGISHVIDIGPREVMAKRKDGSIFPMDLSVGEMDFAGQHYFIGIVRDITERWKAQKQLQYLSTYDTLTELPNRVLFQDRLAHALSNAKRHHHKLALMFIDLDKFKFINDTLGHAAGDQLLKTVAQRLMECVRESDTAARLSGDEFMVILEHINEENDATAIANKILHAISQPMELDGNNVVITSSIGISIYPDNADNAETLINLADTAMYQAKKGGSNNFRFYQLQEDKIGSEQRSLL